MDSRSESMSSGARVPDELETLLEDALVLGDRESMIDLFEARAIVVTAAGAELRGWGEITRGLREPFFGTAQRVLQRGPTALLVGETAVSVARRARDGLWRYALSVRSAAN